MWVEYPWKPTLFLFVRVLDIQMLSVAQTLHLNRFSIVYISDHPMMRLMCSDIIERDANLIQRWKHFWLRIYDLRDFDLDYDKDEEIDLVECSSHDENEISQTVSHFPFLLLSLASLESVGF